MRHTLPALLLFSLPLAAQDRDAARRYHEAYVLEVIEGRIADAAKAYLALLEEEVAPARLRHQSEFRFAVCTALLGRPDEGRARLAALRTREGLDDALRAQLAEYLRGLENVAPGSALDKRLEDLTFELGRVMPEFNTEHAVYRDFLILGDKARPHLRRLLAHDDARVREHALRLLLRMGEPGMAQHWEDGFLAALRELRTYLAQRPEARAVLETKLLGARAWALQHSLDRLGSLEWTPGFLAKVAAPAGKLGEKAAALAQWRYESAEIRALFDAWLADPAMATTAAVALLSAVPAEPDKLALVATPARFGPVVAAIGSTPLADDRAARGLTRYAGHLEADLVLDRLAAWVEDATNAPVGPPQGSKIFLANDHPMRGRVGHALATALDGRKLAAAQRTRYREILLLWIRWLASARGGMGHQDFAPHLRAALEGAADADAVLRGLAAGPLRDPPEVTWLNGYVRAREPADVHRLGAILLAAGAQAQQTLLSNLKNVFDADPRPEVGVWRELARLGPAWLKGLGDNAAPHLSQLLARAGQLLGPDEGLALMRRCVKAALETSETTRTQIVGAWYSSAFRNAFQARILLPVAGEVMRELPAQTQAWFVDVLVSQLRVNLEIEEPVRRAVARVVLDHVEHVRTSVNRSFLSTNEKLFPPELWIHRAPTRTFLNPSMVASTAARVLADPTLASRKLVQILASHDDGFVTRLLARADAAVVARVATAVKPGNVTGEAAERALEKVLAAEPVDLDALGHLAQVVAEIRASDRLVPVARRLLHSEPTRSVKLGITLARSLAKNELRPDLVGLLDSPDANIRNAAKEALESIAEWNRFKAEMKLKEGK